MKSVLNMRVISPITTSVALALTLTGLLGCGESEPIRDPFVIQINSQDIVQAAVDQIEIVMRPSPVGHRFVFQPDMSHFGGTVASRVTGPGDFAIFVERAYIDTYARPGDLMNAFFLDVPVLMLTEVGQEPIEDPLTEVTFIRGADRIGDFERFLDWPLQDGGRAVFRVSCERPTYDRQCTNNDPLPTPDASMGDGGMGDGG